MSGLFEIGNLMSTIVHVEAISGNVCQRWMVVSSPWALTSVLAPWFWLLLYIYMSNILQLWRKTPIRSVAELRLLFTNSNGFELWLKALKK